jgi:hypothetical protein
MPQHASSQDGLTSGRTLRNRAAQAGPCRCPGSKSLTAGRLPTNRVEIGYASHAGQFRTVCRRARVMLGSARQKVERDHRRALASDSRSSSASTTSAVPMVAPRAGSTRRMRSLPTFAVTRERASVASCASTPRCRAGQRRSQPIRHRDTWAVMHRLRCAENAWLMSIHASRPSALRFDVDRDSCRVFGVYKLGALHGHPRRHAVGAIAAHAGRASCSRHPPGLPEELGMSVHECPSPRLAVWLRHR